MRVDPDLFLSRTKDVDVESTDLHSALRETVAKADRVSILSAYYGSAYIRSLLEGVPKGRRKNCAIKLVLGLENRARLANDMEELRRLEVDLLGAGFKNVELRLAKFDRPFHVKLYYFRRGTQPTWFIGSANLSPAITGDRHELMLRLRGSHPKLSKYLRELEGDAGSFSIDEPPSGESRDLKSFFLNGSLAYRPQNRVSFTFEACVIGPVHRRIISQALAEGSQVPYANPRPEGFGFDLARAVDMVIDGGAPSPRVGLRRYAAETLYGYWLPQPYAEDVRAKSIGSRSNAHAKLKTFAAALADCSDKDLESRLGEHVRAMETFFARHGSILKPKDGYLEKFRTFLSAKKTFLNHPDRLDRAINNLYIEPTPDFWFDEERSAEFEDSFFEDISLRMSVELRNCWIAQVLKDELQLGQIVTSEILRDALTERLSDPDGLPDAVWQGEPDDSGDDEE